MASVSYNPQSLVIDSVRAWVVSGTIDYGRTPRSCWARRIEQARGAGLNTVLVPVTWSSHEVEAGKFDFSGGKDLRRFVELLGEAGLGCLLRVGPFVGGGRDMGGLPSWLLREGGMGLRESSPVFLQAVARYYNAVFGELKGLLATDSPAGPVCLVQAEHRWLCSHAAEGEGYLKALHRYIHEAGCQLPIVHANNFYQPTLGAIEAWADGEDLFAVTRQLRAVQPDAPRLALGVPTGVEAVWGRALGAGDGGGGGGGDAGGGDDLMRDMARVSAAGGGFNLEPFVGETNFGTAGGCGTADGFFATEPHPQAPVGATGQLNDGYRSVKRLAMFLSQYGNLMSHLHPDYHPAVCDDGVAVTQQTGSQGSVVFFIRSAECGDRTKADVITPDGQRLGVHFGSDCVAWVVLDANLDTLGVLDLTNLRPWARVGSRVLVFFGPAGSDAIISLNDTLHTTTVPKGDEPRVMDCGEAHLVVLNEKQVDAAFIDGEGLHVGAEPAGGAGEEEGGLHWVAGFNTAYRVDLDGRLTRKRKSNDKSATAEGGKAPAPKLGKWTVAYPDGYTEGASPRYAKLKGPTGLEACGSDEGYGWYRLMMNRSRGKKAKLLIPDSGDRLHVYQDGQFVETMGVGPGATDEAVAVELESGAAGLVVLAEVLGRAEGSGMGRARGVCGSMLDVKELKLGKGKIEMDVRVDPFDFGGYLAGGAFDDRAHYPRYHFDVKCASGAGFVLSLKGERPRCVVMLNDEAVGLDVGEGRSVTMRVGGGEGKGVTKKGVNRVTLAMIEEGAADFDLQKSVRLYEVVEDLGDGGEWHYAKWMMAGNGEFAAMESGGKKDGGGGGGGGGGDRPAFFRSTFKVKDAGCGDGLMVELGGVSKGRLWVNGHAAGRYFVSTVGGKKVPPQHRYYVPGEMLIEGEVNTLTLFDEHGKAPRGCKLGWVEGETR